MTFGLKITMNFPKILNSPLSTPEERVTQVNLQYHKNTLAKVFKANSTKIDYHHNYISPQENILLYLELNLFTLLIAFRRSCTLDIVYAGYTAESLNF